MNDYTVFAVTPAPLEEICALCGSIISEIEFVVNWGTCNVCFDWHWDAYLLGEAFVVAHGGYSSQYPGGL